MNPSVSKPIHRLRVMARPACLLFALLFVALGQSTSGAVSVGHLRCEYLVNPMGIDKVAPRLSWRIESMERGEKQTAWQVIVASTPEALASDQGDLWDSGKISGDETSQIVYAGTALASRAECFWKVRSWSANDQVSAWSAPARWTVGLLQSGDWTAKWIDGLAVSPAGNPDPPVIVLAMYEGVTAGSGSLDATAQITAMVAEGNYALSVTNGFFGGDPAFGTVKQLRIRYQRGGVTLTKIFPEKSVVTLPADLTIPVIVSARYESVANPTTKFRDVTTVLTSQASSAFSMVVNNANFGPDPAVNQVKRLTLHYTVDGVAGVLSKAENTTFNYPENLAKPVVATITSASYEALDGSGSNNVLGTLAALENNGTYSVTANNATFGPDPAFGKRGEDGVTIQFFLHRHRRVEVEAHFQKIGQSVGLVFAAGPEAR